MVLGLWAIYGISQDYLAAGCEGFLSLNPLLRFGYMFITLFLSSSVLLTKNDNMCLLCLLGEIICWLNHYLAYRGGFLGYAAIYVYNTALFDYIDFLLRFLLLCSFALRSYKSKDVAFPIGGSVLVAGAMIVIKIWPSHCAINLQFALQSFNQVVLGIRTF